MNTLFSIAYYTFLAAVTLLGLLLVATLIPIPGNISVKIVQSGSMEPAIQTGSIVVIMPKETYAVGDVITFGEESETSIPTTHRIVADIISGGQIRFETKGDANEEKDSGSVAVSEVIGKVLFSIPYIGYLLDIAKKPWGFVFLIGIPAGIVVIDEIATIVKETKHIRRRNKIEEENNV